MHRVLQTMPADNPADPLALLDAHRLSEAAARDAVADALARVVYGKPTIGDLQARDGAALRYIATGAIRRTSNAWHQAALRKAAQEAQRLLEQDCGRAVAMLPTAHHEVIAPLLAIRIVAAYLGLLEGTSYQTPGETLAIVTGGQP